VVFRYIAAGTHRDPDTTNAALRRRLLDEGAAVIGRTEWRGRTWLKLTLLNPHASTDTIDRLIDVIAAAGAAELTREAVA